MLSSDDFKLEPSTEFLLELAYRESENDTIEILRDKLITALEQSFLLDSDAANLIKGLPMVEHIEPHRALALYQLTSQVHLLSRHELIETLGRISKQLAVKRRLVIRMMNSLEFSREAPNK